MGKEEEWRGARGMGMEESGGRIWIFCNLKSTVFYRFLPHE